MLNILEDKIEPITESGCWIWMGYINQSGYGQLRTKDKAHLAHRYFWEQANGEIPKGMQACHKCDIPSCVNPNHIFIGTNKDNILDSMRKNRRKGIARNRPSGIIYTPMSLNARIGKMKIKPEDRKKIYEIYLSGNETERSLGKKFGVSGTCIHRIIKEMKNS